MTFKVWFSNCMTSCWSAFDIIVVKGLMIKPNFQSHLTRTNDNAATSILTFNNDQLLHRNQSPRNLLKYPSVVSYDTALKV